MTAVAREQRFNRQNRCPVCGGCDSDPRGKEKRCSGYWSNDRSYVHCARPEQAGDIAPNGADLFAHRMTGPCKCGTSHGTELHASYVSQVEATYDYVDETGALLFQVVRKPGKQFRQRRPDGNGGWIWKIGDTRRVLYNLPALLKKEHHDIFICEGEKDADTLNAFKSPWITATTNPGGAGKWHLVADHAKKVLATKPSITIVADADKPGRAHALDVAASLRELFQVPDYCLKIVEPPAPFKDVTAMLDGGLQLGALVPLQVEELSPAQVSSHDTSMPEEERFADDLEPFDAAANSNGTTAVRTLGDAARAMSTAGPVTRIPSTVPTLNEAMRGGYPVPRFVVVGGAPGAGKTSWVAYEAVEAAKSGTPVAFLQMDEGVEGIVMRAAQILGFRSGDLENGNAEEWALAIEALSKLPILVVDGDEDGATVEAAASKLHAFAEGKPAMLVIDSLQTVRCEGSETADGPRTRVDLVVKAVKNVTRRYGFVTLATCELARGAYRSKQVADQIADIAAFKESGGIEYAAQTLLVMRNVTKEDDLIDVSVPKNRAHRKLPFRLQMDHRRASFTEVEIPEKDETAPTMTATVDGDAAKLATFLVEHPGIAGEGKLRAELRAAGVAMSNAKIAAAIAKLGDVIEDRPEKGRPRWFFRTDSQPTGGTDE